MSCGLFPVVLAWTLIDTTPTTRRRHAGTQPVAIDPDRRP
jgi:hypothetical protein